MSFLIIGDTLTSVYLAKQIINYGWKVTMITKNFKDKPDYVPTTKTNMKKLGLNTDYAIVEDINYVEVEDFFDNSKFFETKSLIYDFNKIKQHILDEIKSEITFYDKAEFIDKNKDNVFIKVKNKGTLVKAKYVLNFEDTKLLKEKGNITHLNAIVKGHQLNNHLKIFFFKTGYGFVNKVGNYYILKMFGTNLTYELNNFLKKYDLILVNKQEEKVKKYDPKNIYFKDNIFNLGKFAGMLDNLNLYDKEICLDFCQNFKNYFAKLMTTNDISFEKTFKKRLNYLEERKKYGNVFWNLSLIDKNKILEYFNPKQEVLDFTTMFNNLPKLSKYKLKLLFA